MFLIVRTCIGWCFYSRTCYRAYGAPGMALLMFMGLTHMCASVFPVFCTAFMSITTDICSRTLLHAKLSIVYSLLNKCLCSEGSPIVIDLILRSGDCPPLTPKDHAKRPTSPLAVPDTVLHRTLLCCTWPTKVGILGNVSDGVRLTRASVVDFLEK
jgi:hypothetical protein